ncbi:hypothetical protein D046_9090, partial [Vibrio parahaemolyticus V-223/04]
MLNVGSVPVLVANLTTLSLASAPANCAHDEAK